MTNTCTLIGPRIHHLLMPVLIEAQSVMKLRVTNGLWKSGNANTERIVLQILRVF